MFGSQCSVFDSGRAAAKSHLTPHNTPEGGGGGEGGGGADQTILVLFFPPPSP